MTKITVKIKSTTGKVPIYKTSGACGFDLELDKIPDNIEGFISGQMLYQLNLLVKDTDEQITDIYNMSLSLEEREKKKSKLQEYFLEKCLDTVKDKRLTNNQIVSLIDYLRTKTNDFLKISEDKTYYVLFPNKNVCLNTPYKIELPEGYEMEIRPRSSTGIKTKLYIHNGTIDSDYRGTVCLIFHNNSHDIHLLEEGLSYCQGIIREALQVKFKIGDLNETQRGEKGFGSTGM
jgi:dUTP pyrophosphatase